MSRGFRGGANFARPENALKRADELENVGQKLSALQQLHDVVTSKKHRTWSKTYEEIMFRLLDLCVELKKRNQAKEALMQYRNMCQQVNINSLEEVIKYYLNKATQMAEQARQQAEVRRRGEWQCRCEWGLDHGVWQACRHAGQLSGATARRRSSSFGRLRSQAALQRTDSSVQQRVLSGVASSMLMLIDSFDSHAAAGMLVLCNGSGICRLLSCAQRQQQQHQLPQLTHNQCVRAEGYTLCPDTCGVSQTHAAAVSYHTRRTRASVVHPPATHSHCAHTPAHTLSTTCW